MNITINEQALEVNFDHLRNLEEALVEVADSYIPEGEQLFQVKVNGDLFSERYPREARYIDLETVTRLDIHTVTDRELALAILKEAGGQADVLIQALEQGATLFRLADENEANHYYAQVLDTLRWLLQIGEMAGQVLGVNLTRLRQENGDLVGNYVNDLEELLNEMVQVHQESDFILLADLMEYELLPAVAKWKNILIQLGEMTKV
ncbi:MAG: hypothetical protein DRG58_03250 [Deltaproteobacteria bacterium]|nr:MAG: hypothetical protein DRG58_03250 [Deltaproteobacteria bacterium]